MVFGLIFVTFTLGIWTESEESVRLLPFPVGLVMVRDRPGFGGNGVSSSAIRTSRYRFRMIKTKT